MILGREYWKVPCSGLAVGEAPAVCGPARASMVWPYLQRYRCVLQAVDSEAVLQGGAEGRGKDGQLEPLDCRAGVRLTREHVGTQLVQQDEAELLLGPLFHAHLKSCPLRFSPSPHVSWVPSKFTDPILVMLSFLSLPHPSPSLAPFTLQPSVLHRYCGSKVRPSGAALPVPHGCAFRTPYVHACYVASVLSDCLWC